MLGINSSCVLGISVIMYIPIRVDKAIMLPLTQIAIDQFCTITGHFWEYLFLYCISRVTNSRFMGEVPNNSIVCIITITITITIIIFAFVVVVGGGGGRSGSGSGVADFAVVVDLVVVVVVVAVVVVFVAVAS